MIGLRNALFAQKGAFHFLRAALLLCVLTLMAFGTGCHREPRADVIILNGAEPESIDPGIVVGQPDGRVAGALFEGFARFNPQDASAIPGLAERWEISADRKTYTFYLRSNLMWSTGEPITADDFVYSWRRVAAPATASSYVGQLFFVKNAEAIATAKLKDVSQLGIRALDSRTVQVELIGPTPFFIDLCAFRTLAVVPRQAIEKHGDRWLMERPLPTSGPYTLESWRISDKIRVRKNTNYWDAANVRNEVVDFLPLESPTAALNLYETGQADFIIEKALIPTELMDVLQQRPDCERFDYLGTYFIRVNVTRKPFDDPRVRKALALCIDKQRIVDRITRSGEKPASALTPPGVAHYTSPPGLGYDPDLARKLLTDAGFPGGKGFRSFDYLFNTAEIHKQIAVELQQMWKRELGVTMELRQTEWKVYLADQDAINYDLTRSAWVGDYNDPNTFLELFTSSNGNNRTGWKNPRYDEMIRRANGEADLTRRAAMMQEAETLLCRDELPILPLYFYKGAIFYDPTKLGGIWGNLLDEHPVWSIYRKDKPATASLAP